MEIGYKRDQIYRQIKDDIFTGRYPPNSKLPNERDLSQMLNIGNLTLRAALKRLELEGFIVRLPSKGTYVRSADSNQSHIKRLLVIHIMDEEANKLILKGMQDKVFNSGYQLSIFEPYYIESLSKEEFVTAVKKENYSGILYPANNFTGNEPIIEKFKATNLPVVIPNALKNDSHITGFATVISAHREAWETGLKHLCEQGHSRIATFIVETKDARGYSKKELLKLLKKLGASDDPEFWKIVPHAEEAVKKALNDLISMTASPSAIMCYSDVMAIYVLKALKDAGIAVPGEVALMGCCGDVGGELTSPSLSTIDFKFEEIGRRSVDLLMRADEWFMGYDSNSHIAVPQLIIQPELIARESTKILRIENNFLS